MAKEVIKRGGKHEPFRAEKVKGAVRGALRDIHIGGARAKRIVGKVSAPVLRFAAKRKTIKTSVLRQKLISGLRKVEPAAAKAWQKFDARRKARRGKARRR